MNERFAVRELIESLLRRKGDENGFVDSDSLIVTGRLDSVDTIDLLLFLEKEYGIDFVDRGFDRYELDSVDSIMELLGVGQLPI
jgi:acyl carrier protein